MLSAPPGLRAVRLTDPIPGAARAPQLARNLSSDRGCVFAARCSRIGDHCDELEPELVESGDGHRAACHYPLSGHLLSAQPGVKELT